MKKDEKKTDQKKNITKMMKFRSANEQKRNKIIQRRINRD